MPDVERPYGHNQKLREDMADAIVLLWNPVIAMVGRPCSLAVKFFDAIWPYALIALLFATGAVLVWDVTLNWDDLGALDWLWVTGYPFGLIILFKSSDLPDRIYYLRKSLFRQGILDLYDPNLESGPSIARERDAEERPLAAKAFDELTERVLPHTAVLTVLICLAANLVIHEVGLYRTIPAGADMSTRWNAWAGHGLGHIYIFLLSFRFGRMVAFSLLMLGHKLIRLSIRTSDGQLATFGVRLDPQPGHPDGMCGLRRIVDFWAFEASLLIPPLIYTLAWLAISGSSACATDYWVLCETGALDFRHDADPAAAFLSLSLLLITMQVLALWWPILGLRMHLGVVRHQVEDRLDAIVNTISDLRYQAANTDNTAEQKKYNERTKEFLNAYQDYKNIPLWPITKETIIHNISQLWTILVFLGIVTQEQKLWPIILDALSVQ